MAELWYSESSITIEKVKYLFETYCVLLREWNFASDIGWGLPFSFFICSFLYFFTSYFFIYFFLSFFLYFLFICSFVLSFFFFFFLSFFLSVCLSVCLSICLSVCLSFFLLFFSIFLAPASKLFRVTWVNKLHLHFSF